MAKTTKQKDAADMIEVFADFKEKNNIDRATLVSVLEECFRSVISKMYGSDENYDIIVNPDKGDFEIYHNRVVVPDGEVKDPNKEIALSEAQKIEDDYEIDEEVSQRVEVADFGRRAILQLRQTLASRIMELEYDSLYNQYKEREGEIITAEVYQTWKRETLLMDEDGNELLLPRQEQIPGDFFRKGESTRAVISRVENTGGKPRIILSRTDPAFLQHMLEAEVPEIQDGLITIHKIARIPGERAKIAVESYDDRIDPVGACVGMKGSRIYTIVKELRNENIDVVNYTANTSLMIQRSLSPAKISTISVDEEKMTASVYLKPEEVSLAIGKGGLNIRLSKLLTGYDIDVYREIEEEDVALTEFSDEIEGWIIEALKSAGCDTAKSVLELSVEEIAQRADLEVEQAAEVVAILKAEFE